MRIFSRSFLLPFSLTVVVLLAAMHLGIFKVAVAPERATSLCPNMACFGVHACVYSPDWICAMHTKAGSCTSFYCE
jgi:hypothetical protein